MTVAHLKLVQSRKDLVAEAAPAAFDFSVQTTRPGLAYEAVTIDLKPSRLRAVAQAASRDGFPVPTWISLIVECERALAAVTDNTGDREALVTTLDEIATHPPGRELGPHAKSRLTAYATAIRRSRGRPVTTQPQAPWEQSAGVTAPVPHHTAIAWQQAATANGVSISRWAASMIDSLPSGKVLWEAAAAESGQTLAEWIAVQAARRSP